MSHESKPLVLVVEDEPPIAQLLSEVLDDHDYRTVVAENANAAMQVLESVQPAAITLDLGLPGINGITLLRLIRAEHPRDTLPVIVVTAHPHIDPYLRDEAQAILVKPFDLDRLMNTVRKVVGEPGHVRQPPADGQRLSA